jgi:hypothetical protein
MALKWSEFLSTMVLSAALIAVPACSSEEGGGGGGGGGGGDGVGTGGGGGEGGGGGDGSGGGTGSGEGGGGGAVAAFRIDTMVVKDPHFVAVGIDATPTVNQQVATFMTTDGDGDGNVDLAFLAVTDLESSPPTVRVVKATCPADDPNNCTFVEDAASGTAKSVQEGTCLEIGDTVKPYPEEIVTPSGPCVVSDPKVPSFSLDVPGWILLQLTDLSLAAKVGADAITDGYIQAFMSKATADATPLGPNVPVVTGQPLSSVLPTGDMDGEGWVWHLNFTATKATCTGC